MSTNKSLGERYYMHSLVSTIVLFFFLVFSIKGAFLTGAVMNYKNIKADSFDGTVYPVEFVPNPMLLSYEERKKNFAEIDSKYFVKTPIYNPEVFGKNLDTIKSGTKEYEEVLLQKITYAVPYMGSYNFDYKEYAGSHPGIDIIAPKGTPVKNIANGVVIDTGNQPGGFGNYIVIRHDSVPLPSGKTGALYSVYAHLNAIGVKEGVKSKKGDIIGEVGDSGTATTSHLHFQVDTDTAPFHPFWPFTVTDMKENNVSFFDGVSVGLGKNDALNYTINGLAFVNQNPTILLSGNNNSSTSGVEKPKTESSKNQTGTILSGTSVNKPSEKPKDIVTKEPENKPILPPVPPSDEVKKEEVIKKDFTVLSKEDKDFVLFDNVEVAVLGNNSDLLLDLKKKQIATSTPENNIQNLLGEVEKIKDIDTFTGTYLFKDIRSDYKYYNEVKYFKEQGIVNGYADNTFRPTLAISRSESLKIILSTFDKKPTMVYTGSIFQDVKVSTWQNNYVQKAQELGIISTKKDLFRPQDSFTWIEALKMVLTLHGVNFTAEPQKEISGVSSQDWYYKYLNYAINHGLYDLKGKSFDKNKTISRRELIVLLYTLTQKK